MEIRDLSFKNFVFMFFKNLTFGKITEEDYKDIRVKKDKSQQYNTTSFSSEGIKSNYNYFADDDIMHLKLNIPSNISSQYNDVQTKFDKLIPEARRMISEIEEQLNDNINITEISKMPDVLQRKVDEDENDVILNELMQSYMYRYL